MKPLLSHQSAMKPLTYGPQLLQDPPYNKGSAFSPINAEA
jgi:hypothetical protein